MALMKCLLFLKNIRIQEHFDLRRRKDRENIYDEKGTITSRWINLGFFLIIFISISINFYILQLNLGVLCIITHYHPNLVK